MTTAATNELTPRSVGVILSSMIGTMFSAQIMAMTVLAVFMARIAADYGWSRAAIGGAITALSAGVAVSCPCFGPVVDRLGPRRVLLPLVLVQGLLVASLSLVGRNLPLFYAAYFLLGLSAPGAVAYSKLISAWFFRRRAIALTGLAVGVYASRMVGAPVAKRLMDTLGWQRVYWILAGAVLFISLPTLWAFFIERKPSQAQATNELIPDGAPRIGPSEAIRGRAYWLLLGAQLGGTFASVGMYSHGAGIMIEHGVNVSFAAWGLSLMALGALAAQIMTGVLLDRFDTPRVILPFAVVSLASVLALRAAHWQPLTLALLLVFGVACGGQTSMTSYFTTRYFGVRNFSAIYGTFFPVLWLSTSPAAVVVGAFYDRTRSYDGAMLLLVAALASAAIFFALLETYPYPLKSQGNEATAAPEREALTELATVSD